MPSRSKAFEGGNGNHTSARVQYENSPAWSVASSGSSPHSGANARPRANDVADALYNSTKECLQQSTKGLDFGVVKQRAEQTLGVGSDFWGKNDRDDWFLTSKNIIKMAVVSVPVRTIWDDSDAF